MAEGRRTERAAGGAATPSADGRERSDRRRICTSRGRQWHRGDGTSCRRCSDRRDRQRMRSCRGARQLDWAEGVGQGGRARLGVLRWWHTRGRYGLIGARQLEVRQQRTPIDRRRSELQAVHRDARPTMDAQRQRTPMASVRAAGGAARRATDKGCASAEEADRQARPTKDAQLQRRPAAGRDARPTEDA